MSFFVAVVSIEHWPDRIVVTLLAPSDILLARRMVSTHIEGVLMSAEIYMFFSGFHYSVLEFNYAHYVLTKVKHKALC